MAQYWVDSSGQRHKVGSTLEAMQKAYSEKYGSKKKETAAEKNEASKQRSLGYLERERISPELKQRMLNKRRADLAVSGQNIAENFSDPYSGVATQNRLGIARGVALESANIPLQTELDMRNLNLGVSQSMANVEMAYPYEEGGRYMPPITLGGPPQTGLEQQYNSIGLPSLGPTSIPTQTYIPQTSTSGSTTNRRRRLYGSGITASKTLSI